MCWLCGCAGKRDRLLHYIHAYVKERLSATTIIQCIQDTARHRMTATRGRPRYITYCGNNHPKPPLEQALKQIPSTNSRFSASPSPPSAYTIKTPQSNEHIFPPSHLLVRGRKARILRQSLHGGGAGKQAGQREGRHRGARLCDHHAAAPLQSESEDEDEQQ